MIKLDLGPEPNELTTVRKKLLPKAIQAFNEHDHGSKELNELLDQGYKVARPMLMYQQHGKCAFCENHEDHESRPVEHFRPKKEAHDGTSGSTVVVTSHYWWLAWTWSNLYFSCIKCNKQGHKGSYFRIKPGMTRAAAPTRPLADPIPDSYYDFSAECALLVDPRVDEPLDHLQWAPVNSSAPRSTWRWTILSLSDKGTETIELFGLTERIDRVNLHLQGIIDMAIEIDKYLAKAQLSDAQAAFDRLVTRYVDNANSPFRNAGYWALAALYPKTIRDSNGFRNLLRPCVVARVAPLPNPKPAKATKPVKSTS